MSSLLVDPHRQTWTSRRQLQEGDIVALSPDYLLSIGASTDLRFARGRLTMIEHDRGIAFGYVTWDYPGIEDRLNLDHLVCARDLVRAR